MVSTKTCTNGKTVLLTFVWTLRKKWTSWNRSHAGTIFIFSMFTKALTKRTQRVSERRFNPWTAFIRVVKPGLQTTLSVHIAQGPRPTTTTVPAPSYPDCTDGRTSSRCCNRETLERSWQTPPTFLWLLTWPGDTALCLESRGVQADEPTSERDDVTHGPIYRSLTSLQQQTPSTQQDNSKP